MQPTDPNMLNIEQAAERLTLKPFTLRGMCRKKLIQHMKIGPRRGMYRFRPQWIDEYLESCIVEVVEVTKKPATRKPVTPRRVNAGKAVPESFRKSFIESLRSKDS